MKSNQKIKVTILTMIGIFLAFSPIITNSLNFYAGNGDKSTGYNVDFNLNNKNLKISAVSGKILINNNWSAARTAGICTGSGLWGDPYVI